MTTRERLNQRNARIGRMARAASIVAASPVMVLACSSGTKPSASAPAPVPSVQEAGARPIPYPVFETAAFKRAVDRGTRTRTGEPGPRYWTQYARYALRAELDPKDKRLTGEARARYQNRSPDTLRFVAVQL